MTCSSGLTHVGHQIDPDLQGEVVAPNFNENTYGVWRNETKKQHNYIPWFHDVLLDYVGFTLDDSYYCNHIS
jgi:hypothetical protein